MDLEKVYDVEKIISKGYGKTAKDLAIEIDKLYNQPNEIDYFAFFFKEQSADGMKSFDNPLRKTISFVSFDNDNIVVNTTTTNQIPYLWHSTIPEIEQLQKMAKNLVEFVTNLIDQDKRTCKSRGFRYCTYKSDYCMFGYVIWD